MFRYKGAFGNSDVNILMVGKLMGDRDFDLFTYVRFWCHATEVQVWGQIVNLKF
jgi:hypothetical protein